MRSEVRLKTGMVFAVGLLSATLALFPGWSCPVHAQEVASNKGDKISGCASEPAIEETSGGVASDLADLSKPYYNLRRRGLSSLRCQVKCDLVDKTLAAIVSQSSSEDPRAKALQGLRIDLMLDSTGQVRVETTTVPSLGNAQADRGFQQMTDGIKTALTEFFAVWKDFHLDQKMIKTLKMSLFRKTGSGYEGTSDQLSQGDKTYSGSVILDDNFCVKRISLSAEDHSVVQTDYHFEKQAGDEFLVMGWDTDVNKGAVKSLISVDYQEIQELLFPKNIRITVETSEVDMETNFSLSVSQIVKQ